MRPNEIYQKYHQGDPIDDASLIYGILYFKDLSDKLVKCGPVFKLAFLEAERIYQGLRDYAVARKLTLPEGI